MVPEDSVVFSGLIDSGGLVPGLSSGGFSTRLFARSLGMSLLSLDECLPRQVTAVTCEATL